MVTTTAHSIWSRTQGGSDGCVIGPRADRDALATTLFEESKSVPLSPHRDKPILMQYLFLHNKRTNKMLR